MRIWQARAAVGDHGGLGRGKRDALHVFDVADKEVGAVSKAADDLPGGRRACREIEVVDVDLDLAVELARLGVDDVA